MRWELKEGDKKGEFRKLEKTSTKEGFLTKYEASRMVCIAIKGTKRSRRKNKQEKSH